MSRYDLGPTPLLGYTQSLIDRAAEKRVDETFQAALHDSPKVCAYAIGGELVALKRDGDRNNPLFTQGEARALGPAKETIFLGLIDGEARIGIGIDPAAMEALKTRDDLLVTDLRSIAVQGLVHSGHLPPLAEAKAMLHWHARHRYCSNCGQPSNVSEAGWRRDCPSCKGQHFPRTDPVVIMLAIDGDRGLLGRSARFVANSWSCLAGFIEPGETIEDAVRRETLEEAGIKSSKVVYFRSQPWPFPSSLMIGCYAQATSTEIVIDKNELENARWFSRDEAASMLMRRHPEGLITPPPVAIAHHIIRNWVENGAAVLG
jgi:NAD+ diphosphatase